MHTIEEIATILKQHKFFDTTNFQSDQRFISLVDFKTNEIIGNGQSHNRSEANVRSNTLSGLVKELAVASVLKCDINKQTFNKSIPETYMYDLIWDGQKIEVKSKSPNVSGGTDWINFNDSSASWFDDIYMGHPNYNTFIKHSSELDFLIICDMKGELVYFRYVINAKTFNQFIRKSNAVSSGGSTHYYNHKQAKEGYDYIKI